MFIRSGFSGKIRDSLSRSRHLWFERLTTLFRRDSLDQDAWDEVESILLGSDVGVDTTTYLLDKVYTHIQLFGVPESGMIDVVKQEVLALLEIPQMPTYSTSGLNKPWVVLVVGVNGVGKTTSVAKLAQYHRVSGNEVFLAAGDTFRAAAIEQLQEWGSRSGAGVIAHQHGSDPASVVFDSYQAARARGGDVLIVDTAGRMHTKSNLMDEIKKIHRVLRNLDPEAPHQVLLVLDATTGQNGLSQARIFNQSIGCSGILLTKLDSSAKGGIVLAIYNQLQLPVLFVGTGEGLDDLAVFDPIEFVTSLFESIDE